MLLTLKKQIIYLLSPIKGQGRDCPSIMKISKALIIIILFYLFAVLQSAFLIHFNVLGFTFNLIMISVIIINIFERPNCFLGIFSALVGGFFLDIFSSSFMGFNMLVLFLAAVIIKVILKNYVSLPFSE